MTHHSSISLSRETSGQTDYPLHPDERDNKKNRADRDRWVDGPAEST